MQVQIGVITKLDDGYVLGIHGRNHVARNPTELGKLVAKLAGKKPRPELVFPTTAENPILRENPPENVTPIRVEISWDEQRNRDDKNLSRLIAARLGQQITEEDLMRGAGEVIKTYTMQEVAKLVYEAEQQFFNAQQTVRDKGLGQTCSCPGCTQNQSYPNERGQCVQCYSGEHLHPAGASHSYEPIRVPSDDGRGSDDEEDAGNVWPPVEYGSNPTRAATTVYDGDGDGGSGWDNGVPVPTSGDTAVVPTYNQPAPAPGEPEHVQADRQ